jgi:MFS family permease
VWTLAEIVNAPTQTGLVVRLSPVHGRGRYQGMYTMSWSVAALVAPLLSGFVIDRFGAEWLWGFCAVVGTVAGVGYGVLMRRLPEETADGAPAGAEPGAQPVMEPMAKPVEPMIQPVEPVAQPVEPTTQPVEPVQGAVRTQPEVGAG